MPVELHQTLMPPMPRRVTVALFIPSIQWRAAIPYCLLLPPMGPITNHGQVRTHVVMRPIANQIIALNNEFQ